VGILALQGGEDVNHVQPSLCFPVVIVSVLFSRPIVSPLSPFAIRFCSASTPNRLLSSPLAVVFVCFLPGSDSLLTSTRYRLCFVASVDSSIRLLLQATLFYLSSLSHSVSFATPFCSCSSLSLILKSALPRFLQSLRFLNRKRNSTSLLCYPLCFPSPILKSTLPHSVADLPPRRFEFCFCFSLRRYSFPILLWPCWCSVSLSLSGNLLSPPLSLSFAYLVQFISALFLLPPICFSSPVTVLLINSRYSISCSPSCLNCSLISFTYPQLLHFFLHPSPPSMLSPDLFLPPTPTVRLSRSPIAQLLHCFLCLLTPSPLSLI